MKRAMTNMGWFNFHPVYLFRARTGIAHSQVSRGKGFGTSRFFAIERGLSLRRQSRFRSSTPTKLKQARGRADTRTGLGPGPNKSSHAVIPLWLWSPLIVMARFIRATHFSHPERNWIARIKRAMTK